jgi:ubiquinone/menaquinone biosynthesis C-methylase UbiE
MTNKSEQEKPVTTNPQGMLKTALGDFSYIYPILAAQILDDYGIRNGKCLDIGAGPGLLGIEIARQSELKVTSLDISSEMGEIARGLARERGVQERVKILNADVHAIPLEDNYFDLIVSRGSFIFWSDKVQAFREIYRVLKPGGVAYVGGGDGKKWPREIKDILKKLKYSIKIPLRNKFSRRWQEFNFSFDYWEEVMREAGIEEYRLMNRHLWIEISKSK